MKKLLFAFLTLPFFLSAQPDTILFNFNTLNEAVLNGQDSWQTINHTTGSSDFMVGLAAGTIASPDGSNGVYYTGNGAGFGRTATQKEFGDFELNLDNGGILEIEVEAHRNWWGAFIGLGFDADSDGNVAPGLATEANDDGIRLHFASNNFPNGNNLITPNGTSYNFNFDNSGWIKYKLWVNLSANGGTGLAALFYKVPPFDMDWIAVSDIQGVDLGLTPGSGDKNDPATWDGLFFHSQGGTGFFDNIILRRPGGSNLNAQFIDFSEINKQLTTVGTIELDASTDSGLPVEFELLSGPASINGNTLTLTGSEGIVEIRATQPGDGTTWAAASPIIRSFEVIDPSLYAPILTVRNPVDDNKVLMPELSAFMMIASVSIEHDDVLSIADVTFNIDGQDIEAKDWNTGYYTGWWTPPAYDTYNLSVTATSSEGPTTTTTVNFDVDDLIENVTITLLDAQRGGVADTNIVFPSYVGTFENVKLTLNYDCPPEGCEPWDRINQQEVQSPTGEWIGFMRYITPYGVACSDEQDITDYMSLFQGLVHVKFPYEYRSLITLTLEYTPGTPDYKYSWVDEVWDNTYSFGNMADMQPVPIQNIEVATEIEDARLKIINSGHNWGENNTGNAAEFYEATHSIKVNGNNAFSQHLWENCNPNPVGCSPQNGTWFHDRAGWCPGALVDVWDFEMGNYITSESLDLQYVFDEGYTDFCHPENPDCTVLTCPDCGDLSNPILIVDAHLVTYSNMPLEGTISETEEIFVDYHILVRPNPSTGLFTISTESSFKNGNFRIVNSLGQTVQQGIWEAFSKQKQLDLKHLPKGMYWFVLETTEGLDMEKLIIQK